MAKMCMDICIIETHLNKNLSTHASDTPKEVKHQREEMRERMQPGFIEIHERGVAADAIIHIHAKCRVRLLAIEFAT